MNPSTKYPTLLFPVRLETRFREISDNDTEEELLVRIYPDEILNDGFDPRLTLQEKKLRTEYFETISDDAKKEAAWQKLVTNVGAFRAKWLIEVADDAIKTRKNGEDPKLEIQHLPDFFQIYIYRKDKVQEAKGKKITLPLPILEDKTKTWLNDFEEAVKVGMAIKVKIKKLKKEEVLDKIIVVGIIKSNPVDNLLEKIINEHQYSSDVAVLDYGTSTNNVSNKRVDYSTLNRVDYQGSFKRLQIAQDVSSHYWGQELETYLGLTDNFLNQIKYVGRSSEEVIKEKDLRKNMRSTLWMALANETIKQLTEPTFSFSQQAEVWEYFTELVEGQGIMPSIRIDNQPYAILPITSYKEDSVEELFDIRLLKLLNKLKVEWGNKTKAVPKVGKNKKDPDLELLRILSMQPQSVNTQMTLFDEGVIEQIPFNVEIDGKCTAFFNGNSIVDNITEEYLEKSRKLNNLILPFKKPDQKINDVLTRLLAYDSNEPSLPFLPSNCLLTHETKTILQEIKIKISNKLNEDVNTKFDSLSNLNCTEGNSIFSTLIGRILKRINIKSTADFLSADRDIIQTILDLILLDKDFHENPNKFNSAVREALDLQSHRLDAWFTSIAVNRLKKVREKEKKGLNLGIYGYVENLRKKGHEITGSEHRAIPGGFIHALSGHQAITGAVAKSAFLTHYEQGKSNPFALNLTSDRVQKSRFIQEGLRNGQELGALLGYQLESMLVTENLEAKIQPLRQKYPMVVVAAAQSNAQNAWVPELNVVDGFTLLTDYRRGNTAGILNEIKGTAEKLNDYLDASLDTLLFEAGFQSIRGNYAKAGAVMDAFKGIKSPPVLEGLKTPVKGISVQHKLMLLLADNPNKPSVEDNPKGAVEPLLEYWLEGNIGAFADIGAEVLFKRTNDDGDFIEICNIRKVTKKFLKEIKIAKSIADQIFNRKNNIAFYEELNDLVEPNANEPIIPTELEKLKKHTYIIKRKTGAVKEDSITKTGIKCTLDQLGIGYLDFLSISTTGINNGESKLDTHLKHFIHRNYEIPDNLFFEVTENKIGKADNTLIDAVETVQTIHTFLSHSTALKSENTLPSYQQIDEQNLSFSSILERLEQAIVKLTTLHTDLDHNRWKDIIPDADNVELNKLLNSLAAFNVRSAFTILNCNYENWQSNLIGELQKKIVLSQRQLDLAKKTIDKNSTTHEIIKQLQNTAKAIFNEAFILIPPVLFSDDFKLKFKKDQSKLIGDLGQERVQLWVQGVAQVNEATESFEDFQMEIQTWKDGTSDWNYQLLQFLPNDTSFPWIALNKNEIAKIDGILIEKVHYPRGAFGIVAYCPKGKDLQNIKGGLLIDQFSELIPEKEVSTAVSFQYDAPNTEPPQTLLLAVPDKTMGDVWKEEYLKDMVVEAVDLAKIRMVDVDAMHYGEVGFLFPATYIPPDEPLGDTLITHDLATSFLNGLLAGNKGSSWKADKKERIDTRKGLLITNSKLDIKALNNKGLEYKDDYALKTSIKFSPRGIGIELDSPTNFVNITLGTNGKELIIKVISSIEKTILETKIESARNELITIPIKGNRIKRIELKDGEGFLHKIKYL